MDRASNAAKIEIVSGEGAGEGTVEPHTGATTARSVLARLVKERCGGDRWAFARVDGRRVVDSDLEEILGRGGRNRSRAEKIAAGLAVFELAIQSDLKSAIDTEATELGLSRAGLVSKWAESLAKKHARRNRQTTTKK